VIDSVTDLKVLSSTLEEYESSVTEILRRLTGDGRVSLLLDEFTNDVPHGFHVRADRVLTFGRAPRIDGGLHRWLHVSGREGIGAEGHHGLNIGKSGVDIAPEEGKQEALHGVARTFRELTTWYRMWSQEHHDLTHRIFRASRRYRTWGKSGDVLLTGALDTLRPDMRYSGGLDVMLDLMPNLGNLDEPAALVTFRFVRKLLRHAAQHREATVAHVSVSRLDDRLVVRLAFEPASEAGWIDGLCDDGGVGDLVRALGGHFEIAREEASKHVQLTIPLSHEAGPSLEVREDSFRFLVS